MGLRYLPFVKSARLRAASQNSPPMKKGEHEKEPVSVLQNALMKLGYNLPKSTQTGDGAPNGEYNDETVEAVKKFQVKHKLVNSKGVPDGIVGRRTLCKMDALLSGSASSAAIVSAGYCPADFTRFPWMRYAWEEMGADVKEVEGVNTNPRIAGYLASVGLGSSGDETAWCSAFVNWCMGQGGLKGTGKPNARSWLTWGRESLAAPVYGAVTVLWRNSPSSWMGHVAFIVGYAEDAVHLLGGNQGNAVKISEYPRSRVLGYRWPAGFTMGPLL